MNDWREENFLERLAHSSWKEAGDTQCPAAELLSTAVKVQGSNVVSGELSQHIQECTACREIQRRLALFDESDMIDSDPQVIEAERRLDSWMKGFLSSRSLSPPVPTAVASSGLRLSPATLKARPLWRMQWVLATVATIVIGAGLVYIRRSINSLSPRSEVAQKVPKEQVAPQDSQALQAQAPVEDQHPAAQSERDARAHKPPQTRPSATAVTSSGQHPQTSTESGTETAMQKPSRTIASPQAASGNANAPRPIQATPVVLGNPQSDQTLPQSPSSASKPVLSGSSKSARVSEPTSQAVVRLPAGTRVWLMLNSVNSLPEGHFQFQASLLLPVTDPGGAVLFEKGTQVLGSAQTTDGKTSVEITDVVSRGLRYKPNSSQGRALSRPASGKVVFFQNGQVLETWLDSPSTFSIESGTSANPRQ